MAAQEHDDPFGNDFGQEMPLPDSYASESESSTDASESGAGGPFGYDASSDEAFKARDEERERERNELVSRLNPRQAEAVNSPAQSFLVLAGAGSGKTSVLTARIASQISSGRAPARGVLAVTFTNKAAQEMRHRLGKLLDKRSVHELWMGTFHSLCNKILRENYEAAGLPKAFAILDTDGQEALCRGILKDFGLTKASVKDAAKAKLAAAKVDLLSFADPLAAAGGLSAEDVEDDGEADEFVTPGNCAKYISSRKEKLEGPAPPTSISTRSSDIEQMEAVYAEYQSRCARSGLLDFQDLLTKGVELLRKDADVRDQYRARFTDILVDEFQDTNDIQYEWLQLMKGNRAHVMAVGDDSQSIYGFRGANPANMQRFVEEMTVDVDAPQGRVVKLEQNYRSLPHILEAANAVIDRNPNQLKKTLFTSQRDQGEKIDLVTFSNGMFEAVAIAQSIHTLVKQQQVAPGEIAILYRTNQQSRLLEQELNKLGMPLTVYGGYRFYDRQEIKHMLAYLDLVCDMTRDISFGRVVNFPPRGIGERTIEELRQDAQSRRFSMMEAVGERSDQMARNPASVGNAAAQKKQRQLENFTAIILDLADSAQTMSLPQLIEQVMERASIRQHYEDEASGSKASQEEMEERLANIAELVSAARQFELDNPGLTTAVDQLPEYLSYVALMTSTSESDMSRKNTISLMTVHSSKGLEFDHVFMAGLEEATFPHSRAIKEDEEHGNGKSIDDALRDMGAMFSDDGTELVSEDSDSEAMGDGPGIQEERRLMYVAVTRARKSLTITHAKQRLLNGEPKACEPSRFLLEIPDRRLNRIDDAKARHAGNKSFVRDTGNREYGGDAFDKGRTDYQGGKKTAPASRAPTPAAAPFDRTPAQSRQPNQTTSGQTSVAGAPQNLNILGSGSIRVVSKRKNGVVESAGETIVDIDRTSTVLGNRHFLADQNDDAARDVVIEAFREDLRADFDKKGPMWNATVALAERVAGGECIALRCWCAPKKCHGDVIADKVDLFARSIQALAETQSLPLGASAITDPTPAAAAVAVSTVQDQVPGTLKPWQRRGAAALAAAKAPAQSATAPRPVLQLVPTPAWRESTGAARTLAIIGTAGRDKDKPMTAQLWDRMVADAKMRVRPDDTLVSGGAAWADHLAVRLYLDGDVKSLTLHLPAPFVDGKYVGERETAASAANYYHELFCRNTGINSLAEVAQAIEKGAQTTAQPVAKGYGAMFARNAIVAKQADEVLAYTFGNGDTPADGGTKNTWDQITGAKQHVALLSLGPLASTHLPASLPSPEPGGSSSRNAPPPAAMARLDMLGNRNRRSRP